MFQKTVYLFVGGYLGEILRKPYVFSYFSDIEAHIRNTDPNATTDFIQNPFYKDIKYGVQIIKDKVNQICREQNNRLIIVGHSRGSLEVFHFLNEYPEIATSNNIEKIIFSSPLFGKSDIADFITKGFSSLLPKVILNPLKEIATDNVKEEVIEIWKDINDLYQSKCLIIKTSTHNKTHLPLFLQISHRIISKRAGTNDGVLALSSQLSLSGVKEAHFNSNHGAIFCNQKINRLRQVDLLDVSNLILKNDLSTQNIRPRKINRPNLFLVKSEAIHV